ncbi:uncharacterized protein Z520_07698 [Fonsecaea multimorphosa CBS 102226]|uniref:Zn(2)-C6 fungal-type domain-containing protein n=1 Tax=Fonsecaea multimorphosa CBS 102226 TaxID=1442371 RepID=A0A0D2JSK0_9EURO|nr:uncharacterized protein Z520_07698 [Fonsecaea multimorphosa CBS 102226]KIX96432.1 hypothetical protein Z520_07698 [Fonsecaea multimorphosa CBS 102226]OAL22343.1 hypothetical protein AYO22_07387 [Fonsecaea multimorphosa]
MTTRVSQACQRCQRRKLKCDGQLQCSACRTANQSCLYGNANRKRGLAEGYVRGLERLLGFAIKRDSSLTTDIQKHLRLNECKRPETPSVSQETMLESWKHSTVAKDVESLLPALERNEARHWQSLFVDTATVESHSVTDANPPILIDRDLSHSVDPALDAAQPNHSPDSTNVHVASFGDSGEEDVAHVSGPALAEVHAHPPFSGIQHQLPMKLPDNSKKIIDAYLAYTNCWFPILEPHELLRTFHQYRLSGDERYRSSDELGQVAVLWAVLAYETCKGGGFAVPFDGDLHGHPTYKTARQLIPVEEEDHQLGHTQALLILALINLGRGHWKACWLLVGYALRLMQYHDNKHETQDQNGGARPQIRGSRQAHTLAGCFIFEKLLAMRMRKTLLGSHTSPPPALPEDGLEEWETPRLPDLIIQSQYKPSAEVPGRILSTFNRLTSTIDYLGNLPLTVQRADHLNMSDLRHEQALETLQSTGPPKDHESDPDSYPQFLLSYLVNQCVLLTVNRQKIWVPQTDQPGSVTPDADCLEPLIRFSCAMRDFERTHGAGRVPVMLVAICSRMIEDLVILAKIPQLWTKSATISAVDAVVSSMQKFGRIWPAFRHLGKTVSSIKAASNLGRQHPAVLNPNLLQHRSHLASDTGCIHAGSMDSPSLVASCAAIGSSSTSGAFAGGTESQAQNPALAGPGGVSAMESQPQAANIFEDDMLAGGVNDVYFQLAQTDMMEWSGNWQQEGLQTLGFDNSSFERLYSIGQ